jgi:UPF0755 protein
MKSIFKLMGIFLMVLILVIGGIGYFAYDQLQPANQSIQDRTSFVIPKGQAITIIANRLKEAGLIKNPLAFRVFVKLQKLEGQIQAGSFELSPSMSLNELATELTKGTNDVWITIPEGWRIEEIAEMLSKQNLPEFDQKEFIELAAGNEGYLFPDTYLIPKMATSQSIYDLLTNTFDKKVTQGLADELTASSHTLKENLTMASVVEREARGYEQMRHVAGILWHRVDINMALQADATIQYAKGYNRIEQSWWAPPSASDRTFQSAFNTYLTPGLPPHPIANPGLEAIKATLDPVKTDDLFYIHDRQGVLHYAKTLEEHNQNIQKYLR